jgi:predicted DNA binding CopG/RHH family protein
VARKPSESSAQDSLPKGKGRRILGSDIDFSDIPESTSDELQRAVRVGRPSTGRAKHMIAIRIAPTLLAKIQKLATKRHKPYQTLMHELLEEAVDRKAA